MFCKFCGASIKDNQKQCPKCGRNSDSAGGMGFWDMISDTGKVPEERTPVAEVKKKNSPLIYVLFFLLTLGLCFSLFMNFRLSDELSSFTAINHERLTRIEQNANNADASLAQQLAEQEARILTLENEDMEIREEIDGMMPVAILHNPTGETRPLGYACENGRCIFMTQASGNVDYFIWEKYDPVEQQWQPLYFDEYDFCPELGLSVEENAIQGISKLVARGLREDSYGSYRCVVVGMNGSMAETAAVELLKQETAATQETGEIPVAAEDGSKDDTGVQIVQLPSPDPYTEMDNA